MFLHYIEINHLIDFSHFRFNSICAIAYIRTLCNERKHVVQFIFDPIDDHIHIQRHTPRITKRVVVLACCSLTITKGQTDII